MPLILGTNSIKDTGYDVANSVRFNSGDSAYMHKTPSGAGSLTTWTFSTWIKRAKIGATQYIVNVSQSDANYQTFIYFNSNDTIVFFDINNDADQGKLITNRVFRDVGAWMHLAFIWNTTSGTAGDRIQLWINGVRETSFSTQTNPDQNDSSTLGGAFKIDVGRNLNGGGQEYADYYMAETVYQNGSATTPVDKFGSFDEDSPTIFKPINVSGLTGGTNGFYLDFEDSSNLGNDVFGGTDLTEVNLAATDQSTDTCTNNFATLNPLYKQDHAFSEGNLGYTSSANDWDSAPSTFGASSGKWYVEAKIIAQSGGVTRTALGIGDERDGNIIAEDQFGLTNHPNGDTVSYYGSSGSAHKNGSSQSGSWSAFTTNDILGMYVDLDNGYVYFSKNGSMQNSGDPTSGSSGTGGISITTGATYLFGVTGYGSGSSSQINFGSPSFSISSGNADGNGYGNFEYAVPSGYFSLCTKNLAEYG